MDFWAWLAKSIARDTAGWIAVFIAIIALVSAPIWWWRPLVNLIKTVIARRREQRATRSGVSSTGRQPVRSEVYVSFTSTSSAPGQFTSIGGEMLGGTLLYEIGNHGPLEVSDVRVELIGKEIEARSALYWPKIEVGLPGSFTVHIPFATDRNVVLHWRHGRRWFERPLILPTSR